MKKKDKDDWIANKQREGESWSWTDFNEDDKHPSREQVIVYSKDTDALPVTATRLEYEPCMNPSQVSISPGQVFYALENDVNNGCTTDVNSGLINDPRYVKTGYETNEAEFQDDNSAVWDTLKNMAQFDRGYQE